MPVNQNLYPPIVPDMAEAFTTSQNCKIYFSLSTYNNITDIKNIQISLINQKTNKTVLKNNFGISIIEEYDSVNNNLNYYRSTNNTTGYEYYIQISNVVPDPVSNDLVPDPDRLADFVAG